MSLQTIGNSPAALYVKRIRNQTKRTYAYWCYRAMLMSAEFPEPPSTLSCMAAQAVRLELSRLIPDKERGKL